MHQFLKFILEWNSTCFGQFLCPSSGVFHCTHSNGICHTAVSKPVWHIPLLCVQWKTLDGQSNCPKHVEFYSKNKFEKLMHVFGFIIRIYHDARSADLEWNSTCFGQFLCPSSGVFHCTHSNGICHTGLLTAWEQEQDETAVPSCSCSQAVWHIPLLCVQWKTADDGQRNCPKHVEFYSKNKFEKLLHLVGFIARICHDARSPERHICHDARSPERKVFLCLKISDEHKIRFGDWNARPKKFCLLIEQGWIVAYLGSRQWKDIEECAGWRR